MQRRTKVALALTGALAVVGLGLGTQPALAAAGGTTRSAGASPTAWCQAESCADADGCAGYADGCAGFVDEDGDGVCDYRADGAGRGTGVGRGTGAGTGRGSGHRAGHRGGRCGW